jgi:hypothetical protein
MNQEWLELRWERTIGQKMTVVHGTVCVIPPVTLSVNQYMSTER